MNASTRDKILDVAERGMRAGGFGAVSHRDIANAVGIKSASVHYHFPSKDDLAQAVTARYRRAFLESLGDPSDRDAGPPDRVARLAAGYRRAFEEAQSTCLCLTLGAQIGTLPDPVAKEVRRFYRDVLAWLTRALDDGPHAQAQAEAILADLAGALVISLGTGDAHHLRRAEARILSAVSPSSEGAFGPDGPIGPNGQVQMEQSRSAS